MSGAATQAALDAAIKKAEKLGCDIIRGAPDLLLLDCDDDWSEMQRTPGFTDHDDLLRILDENIGIKEITTWPSKTVNHRHIMIKLAQGLPATARVALQAALGSDPKREVLAVVCRLNDGLDEPSVLFRPRGAVITRIPKPERRDQHDNGESNHD